MPTYDDANIPLIGDHDHYKFLGKLQNTQHLDDKVTTEFAEEYDKQMWVIWTSPLSCQCEIKLKLQTPTHYLHCSIICGQQISQLTP